jgi:Xaa-Pro aminopeptidase
MFDEMERQGVDVLLLGREGNARYASGIHRLFLAGERAFAPGCVVVREHTTVNTLFPPSWNAATQVERVAAIPGVAAARRVGVDGLTPLFAALLADHLPGAELVDGEAVMRALRRIKTPDEVALIRAAADVARDVMTSALDAVGAGLSDDAIAAAAMETMAGNGTTTAAFEPRVYRGVRHDQVIVAVGVLRDGWEADLTRTTPGPPRPESLTSAIARCRPGATLADIDASVHGIWLGYEVLPCDEVLARGMVLSVYADGARDVVLITDHEPELLTGTS